MLEKIVSYPSYHQFTLQLIFYFFNLISFEFWWNGLYISRININISKTFFFKIKIIIDSYEMENWKC